MTWESRVTLRLMVENIGFCTSLHIGGKLGTLLFSKSIISVSLLIFIYATECTETFFYFWFLPVGIWKATTL